MELSSYHFSGAYNFDVVPINLEILCTLVLIYHLQVIPYFDAIKSDLLTTFVNTLRTGSFKLFKHPFPGFFNNFNPLNAELNPICYLLALLAHHFLYVSRIRVKSLTLRLLMSYIYIFIYIYMERIFLMFLDHTQRRTTVGRTPLDE